MEQDEAGARSWLAVEVVVGETPIQRAAERATYGTPDHLARARQYATAELRAVLRQAQALRTKREALVALRDHLERLSPRARERLTAALTLLALSGELDAAYREEHEREAPARADVPGAWADVVLETPAVAPLASPAPFVADPAASVRELRTES